MALDGKITKTERDGDDVLLHLAPYTSTHDTRTGTSITVHHEPGQPRLRLKNPSWTPHRGDKIWGSASNVFIVSGGTSFPYTRENTTTITQKWS